MMSSMAINILNAKNMKDIPSHSLPEHIDFALWNEFQNSLSNLLGIPIALYNYDGSIISPSNIEDSFSEFIKAQTEKGRELYISSYKKAITKAQQMTEPFIYKCYTNQYIFIIPVNLNSNVSTAIIGGHVYTSKEDFNEFIKGAAGFGFSESTIRELEKKLNIVQPQNFFAKPPVVKEMAVPFLKNLYLKSFYEKKYYQMQSVIEVTTPSLLQDGVKDMYTHIFNAMAVLFDVDTACVMERHNKATYRTAAAFGRKKNLISNWMLSDSHDAFKRLTATKKPVDCHDFSEIHKMGIPEGISSVNIFPMIIGDNIFGLLGIFNTKIPTDSIKLLALLANQLSFVLESVRADHHIKKKMKGLASLEEIFKTIAPVLDQEELHNTILHKAAELVDAEQGSLMMLSEEDMHLTVKASKGIDRSILENVKAKIGEGISGTVMEKGTPIIVKDIESESEPFARKNRSRYKTKSFVSIPLRVGLRTIGVINISDKITGEIFSEEDLHLLLSFASYASIALERGEYYKMTEDLKKISVTDSLTGLFNRRYFQERLFEEMERAKRHNEPFTIFIIDIDDFKAINDKYGHPAGDEVLKRIAHTIRDAVRSIDVAVRHGGEEFSIILPYTTKANSYVTAERIRRSVEDIRFVGHKIPPDQIFSVSVGIAEFPSDAVNIEELIDKADMAMYLAKARGKNKIVGYESNFKT